MLEFTADVKPDPVTIPNNQDLPKEMDIFYKAEVDFLPPGKTLKDLTPEELALLQSQYRFSPYRPGMYQGITGFGCMTA